MCKYFLYSCNRYCSHSVKFAFIERENIFLDVWNLENWKYIFWDTMDYYVQIFSLLMRLFMGHIMSSLHLLKERIFFFMCILNLVFKFGLCLFIYPHLRNFPPNCFFQNMFCFSYFYRGRKDFFWGRKDFF